MGRKPQHNYTDKEFLLKMEGYARDGWNEEQIARSIGLNVTYFSELKTKYTELAEAIKRGRRPLDIIVENSLYKRAVGLKVKSITKRWMTLPDGSKTDTEIIQEVETELPPDTGAMMAWLKHRKPEQWNIPSRFDATTNGKDLVQQSLVFVNADNLSDQQIKNIMGDNVGE